MTKFDEMAGSDQTKEIELPGTNVVFRQTPFVTQTSNYQSTGNIAFRTYIFGNYAMLGVWMEVPGDVDLHDGDWRTVDCKVVTDAPPSTFDPTAKHKWPLAA